MRRARTIRLHAASALAVVAMAGAAACGGDDDAAAVAGAATAPTTAPATTTPRIVATAPVTTPVTAAAMPELDPERCEDVPDPADHPVGAMPVVLRPCSVPSELEVHVVHDGVGREAANGDTVIVDYTGIRSASGEMFDTSYLRGVPLDFVLGRGSVILGWDVGLLGTRAGEVVKLDVPGDMAYGDTPPSDDIAPGEALTFLVEVRAVIAPTSAEEAPLDLLVEPSVGATGVTWVDHATGDGAEVVLGSTAVVHLLLVRGDNLVVLLNTWERNDPLQVLMTDDQTLPGIVDGLRGARVGTTRVITMPPAEAFGPDGEPGLGLPGGVDLIVVAHVVGVY